MRKLLRVSNSFPNKVKRVNYLFNSFKVYVFVFLTLISSKSFAQTFPAACPSKDLELVSAALTGGDVCNTCTPGTTVTRTLTLGINNKTGSTRTSFAFWATLEITHADNSVTTTSISRCSGPIPSTGPLPAAYTGGDFGTLQYTCGDALRLVDLHLAWTDAANNAKNQCIYVLAHSSTIDPKCGTLPSIQINAGVNGTAVATAASCAGNDGAINLTPFGGTPFAAPAAPYTYSWSGSNGGIVPSGQSTNEDLTGLTAGDYTVRITDKNSCHIDKTFHVGAPTALPAPAATVSQPDCNTAKGTVNVTSPDNTVTYTLKQAGVTKFTANSSGVFSSVDPGTYDLVASKGQCSTTGNAVTVNTQPPTPDAPSATVTQPTCVVHTGTITVNSPDATITYTLTGPSPATTTQSNSTGSFPNLAAGTYGLTASKNGCTSSSASKTVNAAPPTPSFSVCLVNPTLCANSGSVTITASGGTNLQYSINNGSSWQSSNLFSGLGSNSVSGIKVTNDEGCTSDATACDAIPDCQITSKAPIISENVTESQTTVKAYPNPFSDKVKFVVTSPVAGKGNLDIYNMMGQRVKTIYQGLISAGTQTFELSLPTQQIANLVYVLRIGDKKISGKLLQINQ